ncbi:hypothetical protein LVD15_13015 [Fulvivirga maritima]|uniref:hypothetical protein n=1 Tax=Fulvivirga maritima TaxID=2904247 RepID=UPI001F2CE15E|nr:hypothetical protein [Fulvivirga maritima]UII29306.1 hypothetical protein LVD15_13015 [Fulvivirga maritima]
MKSGASHRLKVEQYPFSNATAASLIYNSEAYLSSYPTGNLYRFSLLKKGEEVTFIHFYIEGSEAENALYSGIASFDGKQVNSENITLLMTSLKEWGLEHGIKYFVIKCAPCFYYNDGMILNDAMLFSGAEMSVSELNQHIAVTNSDYMSLLKKNEKKRLRKCHKNGFTFRKLDVTFLPEAYKIIKDNRDLKGFPMTMSYQGLLKMFKAFPDRYLLFGVFDDDKLIAVAVSILVSDQVLYNFYHGDDFNYRTHSPIVMILEGVYSFCQTENIQFLDLGISSVTGKVNEGLYAFKQNCGAIETKRNLITLNV